MNMLKKIVLVIILTILSILFFILYLNDIESESINNKVSNFTNFTDSKIENSKSQNISQTNSEIISNNINDSSQVYNSLNETDKLLLHSKILTEYILQRCDSVTIFLTECRFHENELKKYYVSEIADEDIWYFCLLSRFYNSDDFPYKDYCRIYNGIGYAITEQDAQEIAYKLFSRKNWEYIQIKNNTDFWDQSNNMYLFPEIGQSLKSIGISIESISASINGSTINVSANIKYNYKDISEEEKHADIERNIFAEDYRNTKIKLVYDIITGTSGDKFLRLCVVEWIANK